jgi:hypothetical protein
MSQSLTDLEWARLPGTALSRLAALRCTDGVEAALRDRELWIRWPRGDDAIARSLLALPGCRLYGRRDSRWHAWGQALPAFDVPETLPFRPLAQIIFPAPVQPLGPERFECTSMPITLVADDMIRPTRAMECRLDVILAWAENTPTAALSRLQAVRERDRLFVLGRRLPWLEPAQRFWGQKVLVPIGYRPAPALGEADLRRAAGVADAELLIIHADHWEIIPLDCFTFVTHASLRLAAAGKTP